MQERVLAPVLRSWDVRVSTANRGHDHPLELPLLEQLLVTYARHRSVPTCACCTFPILTQTYPALTDLLAPNHASAIPESMTPDSTVTISQPRTHWPCHWNWCRETFLTKTQLLGHVDLHLADKKPMRRRDATKMLELKRTG